MVTDLQEPSIQYLWISPQVAMTFLERNTRNRPLRKERIKQIADDMRAGRYAVTHQGIAFDTEGNLLDGQHRLSAIVASGVTVRMPVAGGLAPEVMSIIDVGRKRAAHDFLDGPGRTMRASAMRYLVAVRTLRGKVHAAQIATVAGLMAPGELRDAIRDHDELVSPYVTRANSTSRRCGLTPSALVAAAATWPDSGDEFLEGIDTGAGLNIGDPRLAARNFKSPLGANASSGSNPARLFVTAMRAAQAFNNGSEIRQLRLAPSQMAITVPVALPNSR